MLHGAFIGQKRKASGEYIPSKRLKKSIQIHPIIEASDLVSIGGERSGFISYKEYYEVTRYILLHKLSGQKLNSNIFTDQEIPKLHKGIFTFTTDSGEVVAVYHKHCLGRGEYGYVYLGMTMDDRKLVAVKIHVPFWPDSIKSRKAEEQMLEHSGYLIAGCALENASITYLDAKKVIKPNWATVQKLAWGESYEKYFENHPDTTLEYRLEMLIKWVEKTHDLHQHGISHGDLHVGNVMWDHDDQSCLLVDFAHAAKLNDKNRDTCLQEDFEAISKNLHEELELFFKNLDEADLESMALNIGLTRSVMDKIEKIEVDDKTQLFPLMLDELKKLQSQLQATTMKSRYCALR